MRRGDMKGTENKDQRTLVTSYWPSVEKATEAEGDPLVKKREIKGKKIRMTETDTEADNRLDANEVNLILAIQYICATHTPIRQTIKSSA